MTLFNGRYRWDGTKKGDLDPIAWFPGAYDVKIMECGKLPGKVRLPKPHLCLYSRTGVSGGVKMSYTGGLKLLC